MLGEIKRAKELGRKGDNAFVWHACIDCGKERWVQIRRGTPKYSRCPPCAILHKKSHCGKNNPSWKGGKVRTAQGYIWIKLDHNDFFYPMAQKSGYVLEHRLVMAKYLNRCLLSWETVHHKNLVRDDNRIENLELFPSSYKHLAFTRMERYIKKLQKEVGILQQRVTLLEAEIVVLKVENQSLIEARL